MKKLLYSVLALAGILAVSCNKETEAPVAPERTGNTHTVTLKAAFAPEGETRTEYANNKTFSWVKGDIVYVRCATEEDWYWAPFEAQTAGATTDLVGEVKDGYEPYDIAVYVPSDRYVGSAYYNESTVRVVAPISYHEDGYGLTEDADGNSPYWNSIAISSENPLSLLPLVSVTKDETLYFQTAMGVLKINLTDVPAEADHVRITCGDDGAIGNYLMVQDGEIRMSEPWCDDEGQRYATSFNEYYFQPVSNGKVSFMMPFPVGTLVNGSLIELLDADDNVLFSKSFKKDVVIARNKITELVALSTKVEWTSLGKGMFGDHVHYNSDYDQEVEIQQNAAEPTQFRLVDPYAGYRELLEYEPTGNEYGPDDYLYFRILKKGEKVAGITVTQDDLVFFDDYYTGIVDDTYGVDPFLAHPSHWAKSFNESYWLRNIVVKYQSDGVTPANVQLAPVLFWMTDPDAGSGYYSGDSYLFDNNSIEIRFPGAERVDLNASVAFTEIVDSTPAQAIALVDVDFSSAISGAKLVIAANADAASTAFADSYAVTTVSQRGECEVKLPANAPSGDYYVYMQTIVAEGLTAAASQIVVSEKFYYNNDETDLGLDVSILFDGTWTGDIIRNTSSQGYFADTFTMVFEESDDPFSGDVLITEIYGEASTLPVYGWFDGKTGTLTVAPHQPWTQFNDSYDVAMLDAVSNDKDLVFRYRVDDNTLYLQSCEFVGFYLYDTGTTTMSNYWWGYFYGNTEDYHLTMTKVTSSSAPAKMKGHSQINAAISAVGSVEYAPTRDQMATR